MCYVVDKVMSKLESKDTSLPVILRDPDEWMDERFFDEIRERNWRVLFLDDVEDEFFIMIEAEKLKKQDKNVAVYVKKIDSGDFVHLAEYWDKGNRIELYVKKFARELGIETKKYTSDELVSIIKIGLLKSKEWWKKIADKGIDVILDELEEKVWDLMGAPSTWDQMNEEERNLILSEYLPNKFGLDLEDDLRAVDLSNRLKEEILKSYFLEEPSDDIKRFYEKWEDSKEMEDVLLKSAKNFEELHFQELLKNKDKIISRPTHPFFKVEREIFKEKIENFLKTSSLDDVKFAKKRTEARKMMKELDEFHEIYWDEFAAIDVIFEGETLSEVNSLQGIVKSYTDFAWKFDFLDRKLRISHLPKELLKSVKEKIDKALNRVNLKWMDFYDPKDHEKTEQAGLIKKILERQGKQAVIVADAFRYELAASMDLKSAGIEKEMNALMAMTPTITPIGMGALFSSGNVEKKHNDKNFYVVEKETNKKISSVDAREENIKRLIEGVEVHLLSERIPKKMGEKVIFISRDVDEAGHGDLIKFFSNIVNDISEKIKKLIKKGYTVHLVSDHGFCLLNDETSSQEKSDSFHYLKRYKLVTKPPDDLKYEKIGNYFVAYARYGRSFEKNKSFLHGGISIEEVIIPHAVFKKKGNATKVKVFIENKEKLEILRKKRVEVRVWAQDGFLNEPRRVYLEVKNEKFYSKKLIHPSESLAIQIHFDAEEGENFRIDLYDADDGTHLDFLKTTYLPLREELF